MLNIHHSDRDLLAQRENNGITVIKYTFGISETLLHLTPIQKSHFDRKLHKTDFLSNEQLQKVILSKDEFFNRYDINCQSAIQKYSHVMVY